MTEKSVIITEKALLDIVGNNIQRIVDQCPPEIPLGLKTGVLDMLMCLGAMTVSDLFSNK